MNFVTFKYTGSEAIPAEVTLGEFSTPVWIQQKWEDGAVRRPWGDGFGNDLDLLAGETCQTSHSTFLYSLLYGHFTAWKK